MENQIIQATRENIVNKKINELQRIQQFVIPELLSENKKFKSILTPRSYNLWLNTFFTTNRYDELIVTINDIENYFEPMGIKLKYDNYSKEWRAIFENDFFQNYQPEYKKIEKTHFFKKPTYYQQGITKKDRIKDAILNMYPQYSNTELTTIFEKNASYNRLFRQYQLNVTKKNPYYFAMRSFALNDKIFNMTPLKDSKSYNITLNK